VQPQLNQSALQLDLGLLVLELVLVHQEPLQLVVVAESAMVKEIKRTVPLERSRNSARRPEKRAGSMSS
jgi:hypothetical protein